MKWTNLVVVFSAFKEIFESVNKKLNGKNPDWTEDRKNYNQVSPLRENLRKSTSQTTTKVCQNYKKEGQKRVLKANFS